MGARFELLRERPQSAKVRIGERKFPGRQSDNIRGRPRPGQLEGMVEPLLSRGNGFITTEVREEGTKRMARESGCLTNGKRTIDTLFVRHDWICCEWEIDM